MSAGSVLAGMRQVWLPIVLIIVAAYFMYWAMQGAKGNPALLRILHFAQFGMCIFFLISPGWPFAFFLMISAAAGIAAGDAGNEVYWRWYLRLAAFNFLGALGLLSLFNLGVNFLDAVGAPQVGGGCNSYYPWNSSSQDVCKEDGYLGFLRFLAGAVIGIQPLIFGLHLNSNNL
jgi:hypothetical protein|eukprot:TRINITY_DN2836_c3_g2_i2.p2 TRINITY_DN2836_c3_g2~~TRINITY_DN2836_c3_g2_i2.p2  ORF type:complete len:174 (+),score=39.74 TRINITY_DN2836_c3_g2_i2:241-762(+)